jgi:hypothetical protein
VAAIKKFGDVLNVDPTNSEALTYSGYITIEAGITSNSPPLVTSGRAVLDRALQAAPHYPDALAFEAVVALTVDNDAKKAEGFFDRYFAEPNPPPLLASMVSQYDTQARQTAGQPPRTTVAPK